MLKRMEGWQLYKVFQKLFTDDGQDDEINRSITESSLPKILFLIAIFALTMLLIVFVIDISNTEKVSDL